MASGNIRALNVNESISQTQVIQQDQVSQIPPVLKLRLKRPENCKKVVWSEETVDNENMGKKKSKCCCIYKKPTVFGESSSESDDECEHCFGHPEVKAKNKQKHHSHEPKPSNDCSLDKDNNKQEDDTSITNKLQNQNPYLNHMQSD